MAKRTIQPNDEEIARRARDLARQISGRVFVSRGGLYLVDGSPDFSKLSHCLAGLTHLPQGTDAPTPMDLGFSPHEITLLDGNRLSSWGRGLQKWRKILDDYEKPRQKTTERRQKYRRWKDEIEQLSRNLEALWQIVRKWEAGDQIDGAPYVRVPAAGPEYQTAGSFSEPLWNWLEQLVVWIAGEPAGRRFHLSLESLVDNPDLAEKRRNFASALPRLEALHQRLQELSEKAMAKAVREVVVGIPEGIRRDFGFSIPNRRDNLYVDALVAACRCAAADSLPPPLVGYAAALCATDGAESPLPAWIFLSCNKETTDARLSAIRALYDEHGKAGYEKLLGSLPYISGVSNEDFSVIRQFAAVGVVAHDIAWGLQNLTWRVRELAAKGLSPRPFRVLISALEQVGVTLESLRAPDISDVVEKVAERGSTSIVEAFAMWLSSLAPGMLDASLARWAWNCLYQSLTLGSASPAFRDALDHWAEPPTFHASNPLFAAVPSEARIWLSRLIYYRELCGKPTALPDSVVKTLGLDDRKNRELEYLRKARDDGRLNQRMAARLALLERPDDPVRAPSAMRLIKQLQEVCAHTALEAIKHLTHREGHRVWEHLCSGSPPPHLTEEEATAIAAWSTGLDEKARTCLRELLDGWELHGSDCRREMSFNSQWIETARCRMDLNAWFAPEPCTIDIDGLPVSIGIAPDPFRIFLMGSYFGTCLSLDRFNKNSVLANAYDANKSVVFAFGNDGQVLARKLVCISSDLKLIGYRIYVAGNDVVTESRREGLVAATDAFCGHWAHRIGIPLGFAGCPVELSKLFWYDDGVEPWTTSAMRAWTHPETPVGACIAATGLLPLLQEALRERGRECVSLLAGLGIWPPFGSDGDIELESKPELAEESLALLARASGDQRLARLVFENAITKSGQLEAATSLALLEKSDDMVEHVFNMGKQTYEMVERALEVLREIASPKAWQLFMKLVVQEELGSLLWLPLAVADSRESAKAFAQALQADPEWALWYYGLTQLAAEMLSARGFKFPHETVMRALASDHSGFRDRCFLAQWLPECTDALKRATYQKIAHASDRWEDDEQYAAMAAVVVAVKNRSAKSKAYLRETATHNPSALLALSLLEGSQYQEFIRKTALAMPTDIAALLALMESEGKDAAAKVLVQASEKLPGLGERLDKARTLYQAFRDLDGGQPVSCLPVKDRAGSLLPLLPYVLFRLWKWTERNQPNVRALSALMESDGFSGFLEATDVNTFGLACRMASLLRNADDTSAVTIQSALYRLLSSDVFTRQYYGEYVLLLGKLSGHRLWNVPPPSGQTRLSVEDTLRCAGGWELLMDAEGNPRPVVKWVGIGGYWSIRFPLDPRAAARAMDLLASFEPTKEQAKRIRPATEIERQLLYRHLPATRP